MVEVPRNPYITGGPLGDSTGVGFYGRRDIYDFVQEGLNSVQRNPILLYGQRRIGKTSILRQMPNYLPDDLVIVYFDLQGKALKPLDEVLFMLAREIRRHVAIKEHLVQVREEEAAAHTFATEFLPRVFDVLGGDKHRLVLLFDEMDVIDVEQVANYTETAAYTFREYMRTLMDEEQQVGYVFIVGRRPEELDETFNAQLFRGAVQKRIGHLSRVEMERLIAELSQDYLLYPPETLDAIHALTDGHPFCTQLICQQLWNRRISGQSQYPVVVSPDDVEEAVPDALTYGKNGLNWIYDGLVEPAHRLFLSAAAEVADTEGDAHLSGILNSLRQHRIGLAQPAIQLARRDLVNWRILELARRDIYRFKVEMIRRWIATDRSLEQVRHEARFISSRAYQLYELADGYRQDGQLEDAVGNYEKALEVYPQLIDAQLGLADTLRQMEDWSAAIKAYEQLLELDPSRVDGLQEALLEYGSRLEKEEQIEQAIQQYERAAELVANPRVQARLERTVRDYGRTLTRNERFEEALSIFEHFGYKDELEEIEKARLRTWNRIEAQVADFTRPTERPDWEKAYAVIHRYTQLNPADQNARRLMDEINQRERQWYSKRGDAQMALGRHEQALEFFRKAGDEKRAGEALEILRSEAIREREISGERKPWLPGSFFGAKSWQHTAHNFGYVAPAPPGIELLPIQSAGSIEADRTLKNSRINISLDRLRVADYPGGSTHRVLFDFYAQNQLPGTVEHLHYITTFRVREGEQAAILGYPIFVGLNVGTESVAFKCYTVNVRNEADEALLDILESDEFRAGLVLTTTSQPGVRLFSEIALGLTKAIATRKRNVPVQDFYMGLDFLNIPMRARLAEGSYLAVQMPETIQTVWDWSEWVYNPARGWVVNKDNPTQLIPYNYIIISISRYIDFS